MYQSMVRFGFIIHDAPIFVLNISIELFRTCFGLSYLSAIGYSFSLCVPKEGSSRQQAQNIWKSSEYEPSSRTKDGIQYLALHRMEV